MRLWFMPYRDRNTNTHMALAHSQAKTFLSAFAFSQQVIFINNSKVTWQVCFNVPVTQHSTKTCKILCKSSKLHLVFASKGLVFYVKNVFSGLSRFFFGHLVLFGLVFSPVLLSNFFFLKKIVCFCFLSYFTMNFILFKHRNRSTAVMSLGINKKINLLAAC